MLYKKEITVSTNLDARAGKPGDVFTAEFQTAGRGRLDHVWQSAKSENLMFSMVLAVGEKSPAEIATLPLVVGLGVVSCFEFLVSSLRNQKLLLKWPNDVLALPTTHNPQPTTHNSQPTTRKLCGILCERVGDNVIAGVGVNVNQKTFPSDIADRTTSLALLTGHDIDREEILQRLIESINSYHSRWMADGFASILPEYERFDILRDRTVSVLATDDDAAPIAGLCGGVQSDGSLLVGSKRIYAGEAHVRKW